MSKEIQDFVISKLVPSSWTFPKVVLAAYGNKTVRVIPDDSNLKGKVLNRNYSLGKTVSFYIKKDLMNNDYLCVN